ncbi:MAG TPA: hypothetical protein VHB02_06235 [Acidimicrobiales bacterium]|nr:hypothetical protein [Acidimicrobiales bacterium]
MTIIIDRLERGSHTYEQIQAGHACLVESASAKAGPPKDAPTDWRPSDRDPRVCPVIGAFCRSLNDNLNDEDRQLLKPYDDLIIGTRSTPEVEERRAWLVTDWMVHRHLPLWLRTAAMEEQAKVIEALPTITGRSVWVNQCRSIVDEAVEPARKIRREFRAKVRRAVRNEMKKRGLAVADAVAVAAADAAAAAAAVAAAAAAADAAADSEAYWKVRDAVRAKVREVIDDKLGDAPKTSLQSGLELLDRMIAMGEAA